MTKHFDHIPVKEPPPEAGIPSYEHCLNYIGKNDEFWDVLDGLIEPELNGKTNAEKFKSNLLHYLAEFMYETPVRSPKNQDKYIEITELKSLKNDIEKIRNKYALIDGSVFNYFFNKANLLSGHADAEGLEEAKEFIAVDIEQNERYASRARRACRITRKSMDILHKITCEQIETISKREKPINPIAINASLKYDLTTYLCCAVNEIGLKPSGSPGSFFDSLYKECWAILSPDKKEPCDRDKPFVKALNDFNKIEKVV